MLRLHFSILKHKLVLLGLPVDSPVPDCVRGEFAAVVFSPNEMTVVCPENLAPVGVKMRRGFLALRIDGSFAIDSVGVVAAAVAPIAAAGVSVFVYSTWRTDFLLVQEADLAAALGALRHAGHMVPEGPRDETLEA